jgi:hypothetical protein
MIPTPKRLRDAWAVFLTAAALTAGGLRAETSMARAELSVSGSMPGVTLVDATALNRSDNMPAALNWGDVAVGTGWRMSPQYLNITVDCNYPTWRLDIYTDNAAAQTGYQRGGLLGAPDVRERVPLAWLVSDGPLTSPVAGPTYVSTQSVLSGTTPVVAWWRPVRDMGDLNDPATTPDESWLAAYNNGDSIVVQGRGPDIRLPYGGAAAHSPVALYLEGDFTSPRGEMSYQTTIILDLYNP